MATMSINTPTITINAANGHTARNNGIVDMTPEEAREAVNAVREGFSAAEYWLAQIRDRKGWRALGYESFTAFVRSTDFGFSSSRAFQLVWKMEVNEMVTMPVSEPAARELRTIASEVLPALLASAQIVAIENGDTVMTPKYTKAVREAYETLVVTGTPDGETDLVREAIRRHVDHARERQRGHISERTKSVQAYKGDDIEAALAVLTEAAAKSKTVHIVIYERQSE